MEIPELPVLYSLPQAVKLTGYNDQYLRQLCRERRVSFVLRRGRYFFTPEDVKGIMAGERVEKTAEAPAAPAAPKIEKAKTPKKTGKK